MVSLSIAVKDILSASCAHGLETDVDYETLGINGFHVDIMICS
jgi:hypothetical protein